MEFPNPLLFFRMHLSFLSPLKKLAPREHGWYTENDSGSPEQVGLRVPFFPLFLIAHTQKEDLSDFRFT